MHRRDGRRAAVQIRSASRSCERDWYFGGIMRRMEYYEPVQSFSATPMERKLKSCKVRFLPTILKFWSWHKSGA